MTASVSTDPLASLREFSQNPARAGRELRAAARANSGAFLAALLNEPAPDGGNPGFRYAVALLLADDVLIPAIASPGMMTFEQALRLTRFMLETDRNFINTLLTALRTRQDMADPACALRVLDLAGECATHLGNWRSLARIHADGDAEVKSKCAGLFARFRFADPAGLERFRTSEPRVRANIIQTLWGVGQEKANDVLALAMHDTDNRVAGNACLALYRAGDTRALARLAEMIESPEPKNRLTAVWVIGQCRDGRFARRLLEALRGDSRALRKSAIASLAKIDPVPPLGSGAITPNPDDVDLSFVSAPDATVESDGFEIWLHVTGGQGEFVPQLRPIDFFVWTGEAPLLEYSITESVQTGAAAVRIVYPAGSELLEKAFRQSLAEKPAEQCWLLSAYGPARGKAGAADLPRFETDAAALGAMLDSGVAASADAMEAAGKALNPESELPEQHLVFIVDESLRSDGSATVPESLGPLCREKKIRLHCWKTGPVTDAAESPCVVRDERETAAIWPRFIASLRARYTLRAGGSITQRRSAPTAVAIRHPDEKPIRFRGRAVLLRGDRNV